ncbi:MAG: ATP-dependent Clp protease ATP-binding subunit [Candidatus Saccharibacteria bacterium]|nr:ATP-dependent Clp protease ATP-binding subunit [Candidatus Saccharibacteria bacterium]
MAASADFADRVRNFDCRGGKILMHQFHYNSLRAKESRIGKVFESWFIRALMLLAIIALIALGVYIMFAQHSSLAWLVWGLGIALTVVLIFAKYELIKPPLGPTDSLDDKLSRNVLTMLSKNPTPTEIAEIAHQTNSGNFLATRYAITPNFLRIIAGEIPDDITPVFVKAREIQKKTNSASVSGGVLAIALIELHPNHEQMLRTMKLEVEDLYNGIIWYNYLHGLVQNAHKPKHTGGIARDLAFGYTPYLRRFGRNISESRGFAIKDQVQLAQHTQIVARMIETFSKGGRQNVALIGPSGSGRSTIVTAFADELLDADSKIGSALKFRQIFMLDAASLIGDGGERGQIERLVPTILGEAYAAKNIIIWLDNAHLFFEEATGAVDISNVLLPIIEAGNLRMILTMDQQRYLEISSRNPQLANALNKIMIEPSSEEETMQVMEDHVPQLEYQYNVIYTHWALKEAYRLSERYIHNIVMPGRAINLLESSANYPVQDRFITDESVQIAIEKVFGVKMQATQDEEDKMKLLNLEELIHERMVDQVGAVKAVSDALRRSAAGVRNQNRPIGTFLFMGPTGVGKTELAKALSEVHFHGEGEIIRLDMNEFVEASDVSRLIAEGSENELSLTAQVMKHPFSVVLLDEIEKAHPQVLTTLLQMLDEGILRDTKNQEISFRDAIVIATSNAGANKIRHFIDSGMDLNEVKEELTDQLIRDGEFKPEFLNRFDEICIFKPLEKQDLRKIVDLIINSVNKTLETQKIRVKLNDAAKDLLIEKGYDPKLGARPMRRIVQQTVENLVAKMVLANMAGSGDEIEIDADMIQSQLEK